MATSFGPAIMAVHNGARVQREGWNGKGMYIYMEDMVKSVTVGAGGMKHNRIYPPTMVLFNAKGEHQVGWVPSQEDMFASDWSVVTD